VTLSLTMISI